VYRSSSISLAEAANKGEKVIVETTNGNRLKFKRIESSDGEYYGIEKIKGELIRTNLNEGHIQYVREKDRTLSTVVTIAIPILVLVSAGLLFKDSFEWKDSTDSDFTLENN